MASLILRASSSVCSRRSLSSGVSSGGGEHDSGQGIVIGEGGEATWRAGVATGGVGWAGIGHVPCAKFRPTDPGDKNQGQRLYSEATLVPVLRSPVL